MPLDIEMSAPDSKDEVADWVELHVAFDGTAISKSVVRSAIEEWGDSDEELEDSGEELEDFESEESLIEESFIDDVWRELERREALYGEGPPFVVEPERIVPGIDWKDRPEHLMCLLLSILGNPTTSTATSTETGKLFERLSGEAIKNYLGGHIIIYGHPSRQNVQDIADEVCEKFNFRPTSNFKDRGLDVIGWKPFDDKRPSQAIILFQCAAGDNWKSKLSDMPLDAWCKYITWGCNPVRGFVLPRIVSESEFDECSYEGGILIDRARIYRNSLLFTFDSGLRNELKNWCCHRLSGLRRDY